MIASGAVVFVGLWLILSDVKPVAKAKLMGNPMLIHDRHRLWSGHPWRISGRCDGGDSKRLL